MERDKYFTGERRYSNDEITVYWKSSACVHASYCYRELIEVFDPGRRPWVDMNGASTDRIIETVDMCPTEALAWKWNDEEKNNSVGPEHTNHIKFRRPELLNQDRIPVRENPASIKIMVDGPIVIKGSFALSYDGTRKEINNSLVSICRCGMSNHMPFCDGMHRKTGFTD
jgi:uncharacterized Fe-S cluster protein YjdI